MRWGHQEQIYHSCAKLQYSGCHHSVPRIHLNLAMPASVVKIKGSCAYVFYIITKYDVWFMMVVMSRQRMSCVRGELHASIYTLQLRTGQITEERIPFNLSTVRNSRWEVFHVFMHTALVPTDRIAQGPENALEHARSLIACVQKFSSGNNNRKCQTSQQARLLSVFRRCSSLELV
jgi:hypothetical protein